MFPGRFWAALGSGEAINEHVTGDGWPRKELRDRRLIECADVISRLLDGEEVSHDGLVTVDRARVWSRPSRRPDLVAAAVTTEKAARAASWADGLITVNQQGGGDRRALEAYRQHGGQGQARLQLHVSWAPTEDEAVEIAMKQWRSNVFGAPVAWDTNSVAAFDELGRHVTKEDVKRAVHVSSDLESHARPDPVRRSTTASMPSWCTSSAPTSHASSTPSAPRCSRSSPPPTSSEGAHHEQQHRRARGLDGQELTTRAASHPSSRTRRA